MREQTMCPVHGPSLSLGDKEMQANRYAYYADAHANYPVFKDPKLGFYVVMGYAQVRQVLGDAATFSSVIDRAGVLQGNNASILQDTLAQGGGWRHAPALNRADPPLHQRTRKAVNRAVNVGQVKAIAPRAEELAHQLIDAFIDKGTCDFINDFALPLPGTLIAELLGLDADQWPRYKAWADNIFRYLANVLPPDELEETARIELEMQQFLAKELEARMRDPQDDLLTALVTPDEGDDPLSMEELQSVLHQLVTGGYETVISAMAHGMRQLIMFPEAMAQLRADRSLMPKFINESLRFESPTQGLYRRATRDVELNGVLIPEGSMVHVRYAAANRDPSQFEDPDRFDINRKNATSHIAFGAFTHSCVGQQLARTELNVAYNALLDRLDNIELARPMPVPEHEPSVSYIPFREFFIRFTPAMA